MALQGIKWDVQRSLVTETDKQGEEMSLDTLMGLPLARGRNYIPYVEGSKTINQGADREKKDYWNLLAKDLGASNSITIFIRL